MHLVWTWQAGLEARTVGAVRGWLDSSVVDLMIRRHLDANYATVELSFEDVEFIGMELSRGDGFTRDWWKHLWEPMLILRAET